MHASYISTAFPSYQLPLSLPRYILCFFGTRSVIGRILVDQRGPISIPSYTRRAAWNAIFLAPTRQKRHGVDVAGTVRSRHKLELTATRLRDLSWTCTLLRNGKYAIATVQYMSLRGVRYSLFYSLDAASDCRQFCPCRHKTGFRPSPSVADICYRV